MPTWAVLFFLALLTVVIAVAVLIVRATNRRYDARGFDVLPPDERDR